MIIKDAQLKRSGQATVLSASCKVRKIGWDQVYFSVGDAAQGRYVSADASPFAAALLLPSMKQGEDLIIKGSISGQLYQGMHEIMHEALTWDIGLRPIKIQADALVSDLPRPPRSASFFSGGVDSFYTYLKHKTDHTEADRISSFILVNGFDINQHNTRLWDRTRENIESVAAAHGVGLTVVRSNIQGLVEPVLLWDYAHGGCLAAVGLFMRGAFRQIYIPSTHSVAEQIPWDPTSRLTATGAPRALPSSTTGRRPPGWRRSSGRSPGPLSPSGTCGCASRTNRVPTTAGGATSACGR